MSGSIFNSLLGGERSERRERRGAVVVVVVVVGEREGYFDHALGNTLGVLSPETH